MIKVTCDACGASFKAKDEHAGKRGKCPSCGAPITIPELEVDAEEEEEPAEVIAAPVAGTGKRRRSGGARSRAGGGGRRSGGRRGGKKDYTSMGMVFMIIAVVVVVGAWFLTREGSGPSYLSAAIDLESQGHLAQAKAELLKIKPDAPTYGKAQEMLADIEDKLASEVVRLNTRKAENTYQVIKALEKRVHRDGKGHLQVDYTNWARYMLKRADEFLELYPDHDRAVEIKQLVYRYEDVAPLDKPPTYEDVEIEVSHRVMLVNPNFKAAMAAIDEYAALGTDENTRSETLRATVRNKSLEFWGQIKAKIESDGLVAAGNWQQIANKVRRYLDAVDGVPGLTEAVEARNLFDRALKGG